MNATTHSSQWVWLLIAGILLIITGLIAIAYPIVTTLATMMMLGWLIIIGGILQIIFAFASRKTGGFLPHFFLGLFCILIGILIEINPTALAATLTLLLAAFFLTLGIFRVVGSIVTRYENWGWFLVTGIIDLLLGILILVHWPISALVIIGLFVGIDFLFVGWSFIWASVIVKREPAVV